MRLVGGRETIERLPLEESLNLLGVIDQKAMEANKYYTDLAQPYPMHHRCARSEMHKSMCPAAVHAICAKARRLARP